MLSCYHSADTGHELLILPTETFNIYGVYVIDDGKQSFGVPLFLGTIGPLVAQEIGGIGGILAALGFRALDKKITPIISDKLAKIIHSDYLVAIYDFKKKYNIKN